MMLTGGPMTRFPFISRYHLSSHPSSIIHHPSSIIHHPSSIVPRPYIPHRSLHSIQRLAPLASQSILQSNDWRLTEGPKQRHMFQPLMTVHRMRNFGDRRWQSTATTVTSPASTVTSPASTVTPPASTVTDVLSPVTPETMPLWYWPPPAIPEAILDYMVLSAGMPWWAAIATLSISARILTLPLIMKSITVSMGMARVQPLLKEYSTKMKEATDKRDSITAQKYQQYTTQLLKANNVHPTHALIAPIVNIPLFIILFFGVRRVTSLGHIGIDTGGLAWFTDLSQADPLYVLPAVSSAAMLLSMYISSRQNVSMNTTMKYFLYVMGVASYPITMWFPAGLHVYFISTNIFTLCQSLFTQSVRIKKLLGADRGLVNPRLGGRVSDGDEGVIVPTVVHSQPPRLSSMRSIKAKRRP